jgi:hypothetical protein
VNKTSLTSHSFAMLDITLFFLQASRSIRIAWLLGELNLPYNAKFWDRENNKAPQAFKGQSDNPLRNSLTLKDGKLTAYESVRHYRVSLRHIRRGCTNDTTTATSAEKCSTMDLRSRRRFSPPRLRNHLRTMILALKSSGQ